MGNEWNYNSVDRFFQKYYDKLLTESMISGDLMAIETAKDENFCEIDVSASLFPLKKNKFIYLIPADSVFQLPIMVIDHKVVNYKGKSYRLVTKLRPMKIVPQQTMSFRDMVTNFSKYEHSNPSHDLLWRLLAIISYVDRINIRVATNPEFGKDSRINLIESLTGEIGKISNPTIAKLEYLLYNKVVFINEVSGINSQSRDDIQQFMLACADFNNKYVKRSRASAGSSEDYNINKMSLVIAYNDTKQYTNSSKYFDFMWVNAGAINNRILPFLFEGKVTEDFTKPYDVDATVKKNWDFYVSFLRALLYYKENHVTKIKWKDPRGIDFRGNERWKRNFVTIKKWVSEYAETQEEYTELIIQLYQSHLSYLKMVGHQTDSIDDDQPSSPFEEIVENSDKARVLEYLKKYDEGEGVQIDTILTATQVKEELIDLLLREADIFEYKPGRVRLLE